VDAPHIRLRAEESDALQKIEKEMPRTKLVNEKSDEWAVHYMPLKVVLKDKIMPALNALEILKSRPDADEAMLNGLADRIKERLGKKTTYLYDTAPQKQEDPVAYLELNYMDAKKLDSLAEGVGWPKVVSWTSTFEGGVIQRLPAVIKDKHGRTTRTGKLLTLLKKKTPEEVDFLNRIEKELALVPRLKEWELVVSAEPDDVLTMSTGRGWKSCVTEGGCNFASLDYAVSTRDMVAYAVAPEYDNWICRVWLRSDGKGKWWPETRVYTTQGIANQVFLDAVRAYLAGKGILGKEGDYHPMAAGWSDFLGNSIQHNKRTEKLQPPKRDPYREAPEKPEKSLRHVPRAAEHRLYKVICSVSLAIQEFTQLMTELAGTNFAILKTKYSTDTSRMVYQVKMSPDVAAALEEAPEIKEVTEMGAAPATASVTLNLNPLRPALLKTMAEHFQNPDIEGITTMEEYMKLPEEVRNFGFHDEESRVMGRVPWSKRQQFTFIPQYPKLLVTGPKADLGFLQTLTMPLRKAVVTIALDPLRYLSLAAERWPDPEIRNVTTMDEFVRLPFYITRFCIEEAAWDVRARLPWTENLSIDHGYGRQPKLTVTMPEVQFDRMRHLLTGQKYTVDFVAES
jgi:hypothetical protein